MKSNGFPIRFVWILWIHRPIRLTQCCTQFKSLEVKMLCVLHLHDNVAFTFKWYGNTWNKTFYSQRIWIGYNIELAKLVYCILNPCMTSADMSTWTTVAVVYDWLVVGRIEINFSELFPDKNHSGLIKWTVQAVLNSQFESISKCDHWKIATLVTQFRIARREPSTWNLG